MSQDYIEKIDRMKQDISDIAISAVEAFFNKEPSLQSMLRWVSLRNDRELYTGQAIAASFVQLQNDIPDKIEQSLGKFIYDEMVHYQDLSGAVANLRKKMPPGEGNEVKPPEPEAGWWHIIFSKVREERLASFAGLYISEGSALSITEPVVAGCRRFGYDEVADLYVRFARDEVFHVNIDRMMLDEYARTEKARDLTLQIATEVADYLRNAWQILFSR